MDFFPCLEGRRTMETPDTRTEAPIRGPRWKLLYLIVVVLWLAVLYGFTSTPWLIGRSLLGGALVVWGVKRVAKALQSKREGDHFVATFLLGLALFAGSLVTLAPGLPAGLLNLTSLTSSVLVDRARSLDREITNNHGFEARRIAARGLGTPVPRDVHGHPVLLEVKDPELLKDLVAEGLDPDAADENGKTLLMLSESPAIVTALLKAGADPNTQDNDGATALSYAYRKGQWYMELLLGAGADVHAVDDAGIAVVDFYPESGPLRELLEAHAGDKPLPAPRPFEAADRGRRDWLITSSSSQPLPPSGVSMNPTLLRYGDAATITIRLSNPSDKNQLLDVRAYLGNVAFIVGASHGGQGGGGVIRWPKLTLPAQSSGQLTLDIITDLTHSKGDLSFDVHSRVFGKTEDDVLQLHAKLKYPEFSDELSESAIWDLLGILAFIASFAVGLPYLMRRSNSRGVAAAAGSVAIVCAWIFLALFWGMLEPWVAFDKTNCEILDHQVQTKTTRTSTSRGSPSSSSYISYVPLVAARFMVEGKEQIRIGFATGMESHAPRELDFAPIGETVPCWYDPDDTRRFTVVRTPGLGGIVGLILLALLTVGAVAFALPSRKEEPQAEARTPNP
jgi:hypothetical protein